MNSEMCIPNSEMCIECVLNTHWAAFRNSLSVLKMYSIHDRNCTFSVLTVNFGTQPIYIYLHRDPASNAILKQLEETLKYSIF